MATNYPGGLDSFSNPGSNDPLNSPSHSAAHTNVYDALEAIEAELGTNPSGSDATVAARLSAIEAGTNLASPLYGTSGVNAAKWRTALRRVRRGGNARIVCVGTSNTFGWGPTDPATMNYPALLAGNLENLLGVRVGWGLEPFNRFTVPGVDPGVVHERPWFTKGNWNIAASAYWADTGGAEGEPGQGAGPTLTLDVKDGFSFLYVDRTAGRTFKYRVDGGTATTVTTTGTNEVREQIVTVGTAGTHTLEFLDPTVGTAIILAAGEHVANGITVCNWGAPGLATASLVKDAGQWWAGMNALDAASPDLVIIEAGANDSNVSQFQTDLDTLVSFIQSNTSASVIVCESYGSNSETFAPAARSVAETRGVDSLSWLDILQGDRDPWRASVSDPDHFSQDGFEVIAAGVTQAVLGAHPRLRF